MANLPLKKKYTIWQRLREYGFFRVFQYPECPGLWGTEKKLTYKHSQINRFCVQIKHENRIIASREFDTLEQAFEFYKANQSDKQL